jgi:hypothetical protein
MNGWWVDDIQGESLRDYISDVRQPCSERYFYRLRYFCFCDRLNMTKKMSIMKLWKMRTLFDMLDQGWVIVTQLVDSHYLTKTFALLWAGM